MANQKRKFKWTKPKIFYLLILTVQMLVFFGVYGKGAMQGCGITSDGKIVVGIRSQILVVENGEETVRLDLELSGQHYITIADDVLIVAEKNTVYSYTLDGALISQEKDDTAFAILKNQSNLLVGQDGSSYRVSTSLLNSIVKIEQSSGASWFQVYTSDISGAFPLILAVVLGGFLYFWLFIVIFVILKDFDPEFGIRYLNYFSEK